MNLKKILFLIFSINLIYGCNGMEKEDGSLELRNELKEKKRKTLASAIEHFGLNNRLERLNLLRIFTLGRDLLAVEVLLEMGADPDLIIMPSGISVLDNVKRLPLLDENIKKEIINLMEPYSLEQEATDISEEPEAVISNIDFTKPEQWEKFKEGKKKP